MSTRRLMPCLALAWVSSTSCFGADLLVSSRFSDNVLRFDGETGAAKGVFASGNGMDNPNGIAYGPDGALYVGLGDVGRVMVFDGASGQYLRDFVTPATPGGLAGCRAIAFLPDGDLLVNSGASNAVLRYQAQTGAFAGVFASGSGLVGPVGLTVAPGGEVYVGAALSNAVYVYDASGALLRVLSSPPGQSNATGVLFDRQGRLLLAESVSSTVQRLDPVTGAGSTFASGGGLSIPIGLILHPNGDLLVGSFDNDKIVRFDGHTGALKGDFVGPGAGGLDGTHNFAFMPTAGTPINRGHGGAWYNPATSGQGLMIEVRESDRLLFAAWFTALPSPGVAAAKFGGPEQRWLSIQGFYEGSRLSAGIFQTTGAVFNAPGTPLTSQIGSAVLEFESCTKANLTFSLPQDRLSGSMPLERLIPGTEGACLALLAATPSGSGPR